MAPDVFSSPMALLALLLLGGWTAIDGTSAGQIMISRPFVAASLAGWIMGDPVAGARVGLVLEAFQLTVLPVGAARYPESGPAAVSAGAVVAASAQLPSGVFMGIVFSLVWEWFSGVTIRYLRLANVRLATLPEDAGARTVELRHTAAVALDFLRGMLLVASGVVILVALLTVSQPLWSFPQRVPEVALTVALVATISGSARLFGGRMRLFAAGALGGLLLLALGA